MFALQAQWQFQEHPNGPRATPKALELPNFAAQSPAMGHRERVLDFVSRFAGRDDDEIAQALQIARRQTVNQICRDWSKAAILSGAGTGKARSAISLLVAKLNQ